MSISSRTSTRIGVVGLAALMAATRFHHFASPFALPDASLAVFFLAGLLVANRSLFGFLLVEAGLVDYVAIELGGVSDWCVTPAYLFLVPTYGVMWLGGRWAARFDRRAVASLAALGATLIASSSVAFLISNGSFYLWSGRYDGMGLLDYAVRTSSDFVPYVAAAGFYAAAAYLVAVLFGHIPRASTPDLAHKV